MKGTGQNNKTKPVEKKGVYVFLYNLNQKKIEYLLMKRIEGWIGWEIIKGGLEKNESEDAAAVRESKEEAGVEVKLIKSKMKDEFYSEKEGLRRKHIMSVFYGKVDDSPIILSEEHDDYKLVRLEEALELLTHNNIKELMKKIDAEVKIHENL
jgi:bis(5'-nucleosidyl)-tetraphosphatase